MQDPKQTFNKRAAIKASRLQGMTLTSVCTVLIDIYIFWQALELGIRSKKADHLKLIPKISGHSESRPAQVRPWIRTTFIQLTIRIHR
jgi:hypothetical protein